MKRLLAIVLCCALCAAMLCCGKKKKEEPKQEGAPALGSIVEIISGDGRYTTLATAIDAAGLAETLKGEGPFTMFAPIDSAFAKMPPGTPESLLQEPATLKNILLYHLVPGKLMAADLGKIPAAATLLGVPVPIMTMPGGKVMIGDATVVIADIPARNGVIHVIDKVLLPPEKTAE
ncbi:MAG: fasciclin domain-containing protein [Candidatus Krumholzibacteria bacterium]|nr:fasciclin domain-containing protein [Candidatus Krumholzibacteria bacterium]